MRSKKVFLILDNLKVHHAKPVTGWLAEDIDEIEVFYLPSYSLELNPDAVLKADLKANVKKQAPARSKGHLKKAVISHLRCLQKSPQRVARSFMHKPIRYAA
ncbi:MAG: IS630 family transposase ISCARN25 [Burkholderia gladioli]|nr:MAG: IS630 family transposase ISCARN25 [Burkholderia gladioli]